GSRAGRRLSRRRPRAASGARRPLLRRIACFRPWRGPPFGQDSAHCHPCFPLNPLQVWFSPAYYLCVLLKPCASFRTLEVTLASNRLNSWVALGVKSIESGEIEMAFILWTANASESLRKLGSLEPQSQ